MFNGVKKSGISCSILFCVYIDELLRRLQDANDGCFIGNFYTGALAYADDVTLLAPIRRMHCIGKFSLNANKSKRIVFRPVGMQTNEVLPEFLISDKPVEYVKRWPHLRNIIDEEFTDSECVKNGLTC